MIRLTAALLMLLAGAARAETGVDTLLTTLATALDERAAFAIEQQVQAAWLAAVSPAPRLLLTRAAKELAEGDASAAADTFDAVLDLTPDAEPAWRGRAQARMRLGDPAGAMRDLQEALRRESRDFAALQDLSRLAEARQDWRGALSAWQLVLKVDPQTPGGQRRLQDLRRRAIGEAL